MECFLRFGPGPAYTLPRRGTGRQGMNRSSLNKSAFGATAVLGFLILVSLLAYHRQAELAVIATLFTSGLAGLVIHLEMQGRRRAEMGLHRSRLELEDRVAERTAEINTANVALQAEVFERQRVEEALRKAHDELEVRVDERTRELADANAVLNREILERRQITDALKNSRALYHSLVEHLPIHVWRTDITGRLTFANQHLCEALGVHQEEILGRGFSDFYTAAGAQHLNF